RGRGRGRGCCSVSSVVASSVGPRLLPADYPTYEQRAFALITSPPDELNHEPPACPLRPGQPRQDVHDNLLPAGFAHIDEEFPLANRGAHPDFLDWMRGQHLAHFPVG